MRVNTPVTQNEVEFGDQDRLISKTDLKGVISYANDDFCRISGFSLNELIGKSHNIVRHPDMPAAAFADMWFTLKQGKPWNGLIKNRCKNGGFYWVNAYVSPTVEDGQIAGYTSMRSKPSKSEIAEIEELYKSLGSDQGRFAIKYGKLVSRSFFSRINPLNWIKLLSGPKQLLLLIFSFLLGVVVTEALNYRTLEHVRINGPIYHQIELQKDLIADILPPPEYLLESWQLSEEMLIVEGSELPVLVEKSRKLREEFEARHAFWENNLPAGALKTTIVQNAWESGIEFLNLRDQQYIPALLANKREVALAVFPSMRAKYIAHRQQIDAVVELANAEYLTLQNQATRVLTIDSLALKLISLLILSVIAFIGRLVYKNLTKVGDPLYIAEVVRHMSIGNLAVGIHTTNDDDNSVPATLRDFQFRLRGLVGLISEQAERVAAESTQMAKAANVASSASMEQFALAETVSTSTKQMTRSIAGIASNAEEALVISRQSQASCEQGVMVINDAVLSMQQIASTVREASASVLTLGAQSEQISSVIQVIKGIADQTNLLALNAAIEAARAGEQGRGFAVVADEVRNLAKRTSLATKQIEEMIVAIQSGMKHAVNDMESGVRQVDGGVVLANDAGLSIGQIRDDSIRVAQVVADISAALTEQRNFSEQIAVNITEIDHLCGENGVTLLHAVHSAELLEGSASQLRNSVSRFVI